MFEPVRLDRPILSSNPREWQEQHRSYVSALEDEYQKALLKRKKVVPFLFPDFQIWYFPLKGFNSHDGTHMTDGHAKWIFGDLLNEGKMDDMCRENISARTKTKSRTGQWSFHLVPTYDFLNILYALRSYHMYS